MKTFSFLMQKISFYSRTCLKISSTIVQMEQTMKLIMDGEVEMGSSNPFVDSLKKQLLQTKSGISTIVEDLLSFSLKDGEFLKSCLDVF